MSYDLSVRVKDDPLRHGFICHCNQSTSINQYNLTTNLEINLGSRAECVQKKSVFENQRTILAWKDQNGGNLAEQVSIKFSTNLNKKLQPWNKPCQMQLFIINSLMKHLSLVYDEPYFKLVNQLLSIASSQEWSQQPGLSG